MPALMRRRKHMKHSDEWLEDRIRWKARTYSLAAGRTWFMADAPVELKRTLAEAVSTLDAGLPVLAGYDSPSRWSLIATRQFIGFADGRHRSVTHNSVADIKPRDFPPDNHRLMSTDEALQWKRSWEWLQVFRASGELEEFWVPAGTGAFAIWNVLLMLAQMES